MITAFLGVFFSGAITLLLLKGQTKEEEGKDINVKLFESKLAIYKSFLDTLNNVLEDGTVTPEEALKIKFRISMLAIHTESQHLNAISKSFKNIFDTVQNKEGSPTINVELKELLDIVTQMRKEIYDGQDINGNDWDDTIKNFNQIDYTFYDNTKKAVTTTIIDKPASDNSPQLIQHLKDHGWNYYKDDDRPVFLEKSRVIVQIQNDGKWYFSVDARESELSRDDRRDLYLELRREFGGGFNTDSYWGWYLYLDDQYNELSDENFAKALSEDNEFKNYLYSNLHKFASFLEDRSPINQTNNQHNIQQTNQKEIMNNESKIFFKPWVGSEYQTGGVYGKKVLVLGESHYGDGADAPDDTTGTVKEFVYEYWGASYQQTFLCFERALAGREINQDEREQLWNSIMFYNFFQKSTTGPRTAPDMTVKQESEDAFHELLEQYQPDAIIVWGQRLYELLPAWDGNETSLKVGDDSCPVWHYPIKGKSIPAMRVHHPSAPSGKSWEYWYQFHKAFIGEPQFK